jgi:hypothetical protein
MRVRIAELAWPSLDARRNPLNAFGEPLRRRRKARDFACGSGSRVSSLGMVKIIIRQIVADDRF